MARKKVSAYRYIPTFKVGKLHNFYIEGEGFSDDDGTGHQGQIRVTLADPDGNYNWTSPVVATLETPRRIWVRAQPSKHNGVHGGGVGELTTTVTNGDGTVSPSVTQPVYYDTSDDN